MDRRKREAATATEARGSDGDGSSRRRCRRRSDRLGMRVWEWERARLRVRGRDWEWEGMRQCNCVFEVWTWFFLCVWFFCVPEVLFWVVLAMVDTYPTRMVVSFKTNRVQWTRFARIETEFIELDLYVWKLSSMNSVCKNRNWVHWTCFLVLQNEWHELDFWHFGPTSGIGKIGKSSKKYSILYNPKIVPSELKLIKTKLVWNVS